VASLDSSHSAYAGQAIYGPTFLKLYDAVAYGFNCPVLWRCRKFRFLEHYNAHLSARHLDIGVATGSLLDACSFPSPAPELTLMDLNLNSLASASRRLSRYRPHTHRANVLEPWGLPAESYDSIGMTHLLHCLPGAIPDKAVALEYARDALVEGGVLFGATIFGRGVRLNALAQRVAVDANRRGVLGNRDDDPADLDAALARTFDSYRLTLVGAVGLFAAWKD